MVRIGIFALAALVCFGWAEPAAAQLPGGDEAASVTDGSVMRERHRREPLRAYQAGIDALYTGDYRTAVQQLSIASTATPSDPDVSYALGLAYFGLGDYAAARAPFERAVNRDDPPASARLRLGVVYLALGARMEAQGQADALGTMLARCRDCDEYERERVQMAFDELNRIINLTVQGQTPATSRS